METSSDFIINPEEKIDKGTRSVCYRRGERVYKVISGFKNENNASQIANDLNHEFEALKKWIGEYIPDSTIKVAKSGNDFCVITDQAYVDGVSMAEAIQLANKEGLSKQGVVDFLQKSLDMYRSTKMVPDIFGRPHVTGWYQVLTTPNIKVQIIDGQLHPVLIDVGFARLSKMNIAGMLHNNLLANNLQQTIRVISNNSA